MTRYAIPVLACLPLLGLHAAEPQNPAPPPATELEGAWQEPALPGEGADIRYRFTFAGDRVTVRQGRQTLTGSVWLREGQTRNVWMLVTIAEGNGFFTTGFYVGRYRLDEGRLLLRFDPTPVSLDKLDMDDIRRAMKENPGVPPADLRFFASERGPLGGAKLGLAPVPLVLELVRK